MYVVKKPKRKIKINKQKGNKQKKKKIKKKKNFLYDSLVLYLAKKWLNPYYICYSAIRQGSASGNIDHKPGMSHYTV